MLNCWCITWPVGFKRLRQFSFRQNINADPTGRAVLRLLSCWDCGFESRRGYGRLLLVIVVFCQVEVSATGWSLIRMSPKDCGVPECDFQTSTMRMPRPTRAVEPVKGIRGNMYLDH